MIHFEPGTEVFAKINGKKVPATVLETSFASQGDYLWCKVQVEVSNPWTPGQIIKQIYPEPIQSYKLTYREQPALPRKSKRERQEALLRNQRQYEIAINNMARQILED